MRNLLIKNLCLYYVGCSPSLCIFSNFYFQKTPVVGIMSAAGSVVFAASDGYDAEMWDDTALIREYDRALESSR